MVNCLLKSGVFFCLILVFLTLNIEAQKKTCNLMANVLYSEKELPVKNASAVIVNVETKEEYRSQATENILKFADFEEGRYVITLKKEGFQQTVYSFDLSCKELDSNNFKSIKIYLWEGDSKEKVTVRGESSEQIKDKKPQASFKIGSENVKLGSENLAGKTTSEILKAKAKAAGILNYDATYLEKPEYPAAAKGVKASGIVYVQITVNEKGKVESAEAVEGHPLLYPAAVKAAKKAKFNPRLENGKPVKFSGKLIYNFVLN
jgi:TonB family protein